MKMLRALSLMFLVCASLSAPLALAPLASAQNAALLPVPRIQFLDANGYPLSGGLVYTCVAGSSCPGTPLASYTDSTAGTPNANPVVLDAGGYGNIWLGSSSYKITLQSSLGVTQWTQDNVTAGALALSGSLAGTNGATLIRYTSSGSGAVSRTLSSKLGDVISVKDFGAAGNGTTDDTAAINAAITAATTGQVVLLPAGTYKITSAITIGKSITLQGAGSGGLSLGATLYDTFATATRIVNASTAANAIVVQPTGTTWISGLTLRDFAVEGNRNVASVTAGDNILFAGGALAIRHVLVENVLSFHAFGSGFNIQDNTYGLTFLQAMAYRNHANGISITSTGAGQPSSLNFTDSWGDLNDVDDFQVSSANAADINITGGFYADSQNGIHVLSAAVNANVSIINSHVEADTGKGIWFEGGYGHSVINTTVTGNGYGVYVANAGTNAFQISTRLVGNIYNGNITNDVFIAATARNVRVESGDSILNKPSISDAGQTTQWMGYPYHSFLKNSYAMLGTTPCLNLQDSTASQATPNKSICSKLGYLQFLNSAGSAVAMVSDAGNLQWAMGAGSFLFSGTPTGTRTVTFPDASGTAMFGFGGNAGTGTVGTISSQSVSTGACVDTGAVTVTGYAAGMGILATPTLDPGAFFVQKAYHTDASHFKIQECNVSSTSQTINAVGFYVRILQ